MAFVAADGSALLALVVGTGPKARSWGMFERMHALGLRTVVVADVNSWVHELEAAGLVHKVVVVEGLARLPQQEPLALAVVEALQAAAIGKVDGVYNTYNKYLLLSSLVAEKLGVITNSYEAVRRCVFKDQTRQCLIACGLEPWKTFPCSTVEEMQLAAGQMYYPAILKPAKGSGSVGVTKVFSGEEAVQTFEALLAKRQIAGEVFLLEEYVDGPELGVEIVMQRGKVVFCSVMDATKQTYGQFFQGTGRSFPTCLGTLIEALVRSHCVAAVHALGLTTGVFDMDVRYSPQSGVRILEVNARMGGGSVSKMHHFVYNMDLVEINLQTLMGVPVDYLVGRGPVEASMCYEAGWVESPYSGTIGGVGIDAFTENLRTIFRDHPNILELDPQCSNGDRINGNKVPGLPSTLINVYAKGSQKRFAEQHLASVLCAAEERIADLVLPPEPKAEDAAAAVAPVAVMDCAVSAVVSTAVLGTVMVAQQLADLHVLSPTNLESVAEPSFCMAELAGA